MRNKLFLFILLTSVVLYMSCATAIETAKNVDEYTIIDVPTLKTQMDFIGFKIDTNILSTTSSSKIAPGTLSPKVDTVLSEFDQAKAIANTKSLRQLGYNLNSHRIAYDKSSAYFGIYSLQELELYKTDMRYVTFVEVAKSKLDFNENKAGKAIFAGMGAGLLGGGLVFLAYGNAYKNDQYENVKKLADTYATVGGIFSIAGGLLMIPALTKSKTDVTFDAMYNIYLYDTITKSLIRKDTVTVNVKETFQGSITYSDSSREVVNEYLSTHIYNAVMQKYVEINSWLRTINN